MSTANEIILDAGLEIGIHSIANPIDPSTIVRAVSKLNSMLEMWLEDGIELNTTLVTTADDEVNEPVLAREAIVTNLALAMAPLFSNGRQKVSPELRAQARMQYHKIKDLFEVVTIPEKGVSSTLPKGAGNRQRNTRLEDTFFQPGETIKN